MSSNSKWRIAFWIFLIAWLGCFVVHAGFELGWIRIWDDGSGSPGGFPKKSAAQSALAGLFWLAPALLYIFWEMLVFLGGSTSRYDEAVEGEQAEDARS